MFHITILQSGIVLRNTAILPGTNKLCKSNQRTAVTQLWAWRCACATAWFCPPKPANPCVMHIFLRGLCVAVASCTSPGLGTPPGLGGGLVLSVLSVFPNFFMGFRRLFPCYSLGCPLVFHNIMFSSGPLRFTLAFHAMRVPCRSLAWLGHSFVFFGLIWFPFGCPKCSFGVLQCSAVFS